MNVAHYLSALLSQEIAPAETRIILLVTSDNTLVRRLMRILNDKSGMLRMDEARPYQLPIATSVAQARACMGRATPSAIVLDESVAAGGLPSSVLQDFSRFAPVVFLAAAENFARWCTQFDTAALIQQGLVECVPRIDDFVPLAARLIERHAGANSESPGSGLARIASCSMTTAVPDQIQLDPKDAPREFGEVLRHEVNNPLTGILGNAELILAHRDRLSADAVQRLEVIAELAIRLRETVRGLSNALERRPAHAPSPLQGSPEATRGHRQLR
jgi:signal transduction histidine kinase